MKEKTHDEIVKLSQALTGELKLRETQEKFEELKEKALKRRKNAVNKGIVEGEVKIEDEDSASLNQKVIQNIKLFEWKAPIRPVLVFEMKSFTAIVALFLLFILYLAILGHFALMAALISLLFFIYVARTTEPIQVSHKITARGIDTMEKLYEWFMLGEFWFCKKNNQEMLVVDTKLRAPSKLIMLIDPDDRQAIFTLLQDKLLYRDVRDQSFVDKLVWGDMMKLEEV
ncbi:hypothetical protein GF357_00340 [Candidatus Dojkabacteria bacterium]|nr:hypothetical protein [Candidatus Dojkabacteria bacterium]